jgi:WD40 repeat protein
MTTNFTPVKVFALPSTPSLLTLTQLGPSECLLALVYEETANQVMLCKILDKEVVIMKTVRIEVPEERLRVCAWGDGVSLAVAGTTGMIYLAEIMEGGDGKWVAEVENMPGGHSVEVTDIKFNPVHLNILASSSLDKSIRIWSCDHLSKSYS